ncbi:glycoside hydrolase family 79 protein [Viridothelium virens]|uniref:Glycoside hydrolase family 79 protein n=1 Tax=Viridothelium virens TaxID=1048519 RepID=A0A6A6HLX2_VIRVR|nr:glycoside hydrolase family 79 protein [Viridothelium virens]
MRKAHFLSSIFLSLASAQESTISLPINNTAPIEAAVVDPTFPAFAFEEASFYSYFGNTSSATEFSLNLLSNVVNRTNGSTVIRVGGTSLDQSHYNSSLKNFIHYPKGQVGAPIPKGVAFGPKFFSAFHAIPFAKYIFDIPFFHNNKNNSIEWTKAGYKAIGADRIAAFELGNEVDHYSSKIRKSWDPSTYVTEWANWTSTISSALGLPPDAKIWDACTYSAEASGNSPPPGGPWTVPQAFTSGNLSTYKSRISTVSLHYYQALHEQSGNLSSLLLNHTFTKERMSNFSSAVEFLNKQDPPIPLDLAEVGPAIDLPKDAGDISGVFSAALWLSDMLLHGMNIGIRRINYQQILGGELSLWQPSEARGKEARVDPKYYGLIFAADFVGKEKGVKVKEVDVGHGMGERLSAYAAWSGEGELLRVAVVNLEEWNNSTGSARRPNVTVEFSAPEGAQKMEVRKLESTTGAQDDKEEDISYAGVTYTFANNGKGEQKKGDGVERIAVKDGKVKVVVKASEAVMISNAN